MIFPLIETREQLLFQNVYVFKLCLLGFLSFIYQFWFFREDSSEGEAEEENEPDLETYIMEVGRVVCVEASDKKRNKDNWFPGLVVIPSAQPTVRINVKDEFLVRSFKDGR